MNPNERPDDDVDQPLVIGEDGKPAAADSVPVDGATVKEFGIFISRSRVYSYDPVEFAHMQTRTAIVQALSRGYCTPANGSKVLDPVLIDAMADEVMTLLLNLKLNAAIDVVNASGMKVAAEGMEILPRQLIPDEWRDKWFVLDRESADGPFDNRDEAVRKWRDQGTAGAVVQGIIVEKCWKEVLGKAVRMAQADHKAVPRPFRVVFCVSADNRNRCVTLYGRSKASTIELAVTTAAAEEGEIASVRLYHHGREIPMYTPGLDQLTMFRYRAAERRRNPVDGRPAGVI